MVATTTDRSHVFLTSAHSPCLCRLPRRRGRRPGRGCRRRCAPAGEPVASSSHPETQGGGKVREVDLWKSPRGKKKAVAKIQTNNGEACTDAGEAAVIIKCVWSSLIRWDRMTMKWFSLLSHGRQQASARYGCKYNCQRFNWKKKCEMTTGQHKRMAESYQQERRNFGPFVYVCSTWVVRMNQQHVKKKDQSVS